MEENSAPNRLRRSSTGQSESTDPHRRVRLVLDAARSELADAVERIDFAKDDVQGHMPELDFLDAFILGATDRSSVQMGRARNIMRAIADDLEMVAERLRQQAEKAETRATQRSSFDAN